MADKILVSTAEMRATIGRYNEAQRTMMDAQKSMGNALRNLDSCWKGPAWAAMMAKWANIEANILKSQEAVNRSVLALNNTISYYEDHETENKSTGANLDIGTASATYVD